ncbi:MAG: hypothetical protein JST54_09050 [Deltaproteobacteria bacterium]|nr:hypothetical protein [Deltaproteobacteria bacterium]
MKRLGTLFLALALASGCGGNKKGASSSSGSASASSTAASSTSGSGSSSGSTATSSTSGSSGGGSTGQSASISSSSGSTGTHTTGSHGSTTTGTTTSSSTGTTGSNQACTPVSSVGSPPANDTCSGAQVIDVSQLGTPISGTTLNAQNDFAYDDSVTPSCTGFSTPGPDVVYAFTPTTTAEYMLNVDPNGTGLGWDVAIYVLPTCPASCQNMPVCMVGADAAGTGQPETLTTTFTAGTTYFIIVDSWTSGDSGAFTLTLTELVPPSNDTCTNPKNLPEGADAGLVGELFLGAANDYNPSAASTTCTGNDESTPDVVYSFTPSETGAYVFTLDGSYANSSIPLDMYVLDSCPASGASITSCTGALNGFDGDSATASLTAGHTYAVVVEASPDVPAAGTSFNLTAYGIPPPSNDSCASPTVLPEGSAGLTHQTIYGAGNDYAPSASASNCTGADESSPDVVYSFTPSQTGQYAIQVLGTDQGSSAQLDFYVLDGCPAAGSAVTSCEAGVRGASNNYLVANLTANQPYAIVVEEPQFASAFLSFTLTAQPFSPPVNDTCANALTLNPGPTGVSGSYLDAQNDYSPNFNSSQCTGQTESGPDLVYAFTPPESGNWTLTLTPSSSADNVALYVLDSCPTSNSITQCLGGKDSAGVGVSEVLNISLNAGTTYDIVVDSYSSTASGGFTLTATGHGGSFSDDCISVDPDGGSDVPLASLADGGLAASMAVSTVGYSDDSASAASGLCETAGLNGGDRVFHISLPQAVPSLTASVTPDPDGGFEPVIYLRSGPCTDSDLGIDGGAGTELACGLTFAGAPAIFTTGPLDAGDYFLWVDSLYLGEGSGTLSVTVP